MAGLSPRVRGNPRHRQPPRLSIRSIPARAGEPVGPLADFHANRVYPRACGGTIFHCFEQACPKGLSPRVRGNRRSTSLRWSESGSIPARAGEPEVSVASMLNSRVYPRACGGTRWQVFDCHRKTGLSPRVRGNRCGGKLVPRIFGSIPARAGEPVARHVSRLHARVYPRACGGTRRKKSSVAFGAGLSPRVRGNPQITSSAGTQQGSIPARAGEPVIFVHTMKPAGVYPRACGGTANGTCLAASPRGLSPRVRGNPDQILRGDGGRRSIPARAGEPSLLRGLNPAS